MTIPRSPRPRLRQKGHTEFYRGREYTVDLLPKVKIEIVIPDELKEKTIQAIIGAARTGKIGDGKIFVTRIDEAIRRGCQLPGDQRHLPAIRPSPSYDTFPLHRRHFSGAPLRHAGFALLSCVLP